MHNRYEQIQPTSWRLQVERVVRADHVLLFSGSGVLLVRGLRGYGDQTWMIDTIFFFELVPWSSIRLPTACRQVLLLLPI